MRFHSRRFIGTSSALALGGVVLSGTLSAQVTERVSLPTSGPQPLLDSRTPACSANGRHVAFVSEANNLVPGDTNFRRDIFLRDRILGTTTRVSVSTAGAQGNGHCAGPRISPDGRYIAFSSESTNLTGTDINAGSDVFLHDCTTGVTEMVSIGSSGVQGSDWSDAPSISPDGRFMAFCSRSTDLVPSDTNGANDVFLRDRLLGTTQCISVGLTGFPGNDGSFAPAISADGRYVAFMSYASNLVPGDTNNFNDIFVRDRELGLTQRINLGPGGVQANIWSYGPVITPDGRFVAFYTSASNLVGGDLNNHTDIFLKDRLLGTLEIVSWTSIGTQPNDGSFEAALSDDGRVVAFQSIAMGIVPGDNNGSVDVFLRDRQLATTERVSLASNGDQGSGQSYSASLSADGRYVAFDSTANNFSPGDTNEHFDVFIRDRAASGFASDCDAGSEGTVACPCGNPPEHPGQGCDNSSGTGGAILNAAGAAYLAIDGLRFTTSGQGQSSLSIVMQGNAGIPDGAVYGQGVRCLGGTVIRRLYIKQAVGGSITAPDPATGDLSVSAESAARGDVIHAGESRWYLVYYRDPVVLGGCPESRTFNATQTGMVTWSL